MELGFDRDLLSIKCMDQGVPCYSRRVLCVLGNVCIVHISTNDFQSFYCYSIVHSSRCARSMNLHFFLSQHNLVSNHQGYGNHMTFMIMFLIYFANIIFTMYYNLYLLHIPFHLIMLSSNDYINYNDKVIIEYNLRDKE